VLADDRREREALLGRVCEALDCAPVQQIGKLLVLWRPPPKETAVPRERTPQRRPAPAQDRVPESHAVRRRVPPGKAPSGVPRAASPRRRRGTG
jgi:hypothetical protein